MLICQLYFRVNEPKPLTSSISSRWTLECVQRFWASPDLSITPSSGARRPRYYLSLTSLWHQGLILFSPLLLTHSFSSWRGIIKVKIAEIWMSYDHPSPLLGASSLLDPLPSKLIILWSLGPFDIWRPLCIHGLFTEQILRLCRKCFW